MPSSLPRPVPAITRASAARASRRARSSVTTTKLCSIGSIRRIRARQCCIRSTGETLWAAIRRAALVMVRNSSISEFLGLEDLGRFGLARQRWPAVALDHLFNIGPAVIDSGDLSIRQLEPGAPDQN